MIAQAWYICVVASARERQQERAAHTLQVTTLEFSSQRKRQHTPGKLQRWSSVLNASGSRNVLIIRIIIPGSDTGAVSELIRAVATAWVLNR